MIESISRSISIRIKTADPEGVTTSIDVMAYSIGVYLNFVFAAALILVAGIATGSIGMTLLAFGSFCLIRMFSGGFHFNSLTACSIVTALLIAPIPHIEITRTYVLLFTCVTVLAFIRYSPNMDQETTNMNPKYYPLMKVISTALVCTNFVFKSDVLALSFLLQGVLIIPFWKGGARKW